MILGPLDYGTLDFRDHGSLRPWDFGPLDFANVGVWGHETLGPWEFETMGIVIGISSTEFVFSLTI